jgi:hypothetical protein
MIDFVSERWIMGVSEWMIECEWDRFIEWVIHWVSEWVGEFLSKWLGEWMRKSVSHQKIFLG